MTLKFTRLKRRYLGLHQELASGDRGIDGNFRVLQSLHDNSIIIEYGPDRDHYQATLYDLMDHFFDEGFLNAVREEES